MSQYVEADGKIGFQDQESMDRAIAILKKGKWLVEKEGKFFWGDEDGDIIEDEESPVQKENLILSLDNSPSLNFARALEMVFGAGGIDEEATVVRLTCFDGAFDLSEYRPEDGGLHSLTNEEVIEAIGFDPDKLDYDIFDEEVNDENRDRHPWEAEDAAREWRFRA